MIIHGISRKTCLITELFLIRFNNLGLFIFVAFKMTNLLLIMIVNRYKSIKTDYYKIDGFNEKN
jgi:hypothetical protein